MEQRIKQLLAVVIVLTISAVYIPAQNAQSRYSAVGANEAVAVESWKVRLYRTMHILSSTA